MDKNCLFCKIITGEIPSNKVFENEFCIAFRDIDPQAPTHILVVPRIHKSGLNAFDEEDSELLGHLFLAAQKVAMQEGIAETGYRTVINSGDEGGQTVHHLHIHLLGGRQMTWPPG
jgi:histidine triad (HIT) family protein